ncbi:MAG: GNAT family N-acetyltransferase [Chloroflexi bacterium]|nr:GNAT family N-acetyltransferase [Chloroflexota bacterium]MBU1748554.1 GNAT family N-acetyltransferase [Chloroflexota bacterium]MBU1879880.1 GNAT family N-acetyltransferase [Chloroflexota bacterium]
MATTIHTELTLPNDKRVLPVALAHVRELAKLAELPPKETQGLVLAADEACANVIEHAFDPGESGTFVVGGEASPTALTLTIRDQGLPFDPSVAPTYTLPTGTDAASVNTQGLGLYLIHQMVDEVHWINHGREGKELRLVKYRPQQDVTAQVLAAELAPFRDDELLAPPQEYAIRRMRPEEAVWVARCIYRAYGYTYFNEDLYYPDRIVHQNEIGTLVSAVAVAQGSDQPELVGHCAVERPDLGRVAELGQAVVVPAHRKRGLLERMTAFLEEEGRKLGMVGFFADAVTSHVYSQRAIERLGFLVCGISLGVLPRSVSFKKISTEPLSQRETCILYFRHLAPPASVAIYAPAHHRAMIEQIYANLAAPVEFLEPGAAEGPARMAVSSQKSLGTGTIRVQHVGIDAAAEIRQMRRDLCEIAGAEAVYLELPLAQAGTPELCQMAEEDGFFFSSIGPSFASDGDILRLQYLNAPLDPSQIQVADPFGRQVLAYATDEWDRVTQLRQQA